MASNCLRTEGFGFSGAIEPKVPRLRERIEQLELQLAAQQSVAQVLAGAPEPEQALGRLLEAIVRSLRWRVGTFWELPLGTDRLRLNEMWHEGGDQLAAFERVSREKRLPEGVGLPGRVLAGGAPVWIADLARDRNFVRAEAAASAGLRSALAFPVRSDRGVLGVIECFTPEITDPAPELLRTLEAIGAQIGQYIERRRAEEAARRSDAVRAAMLRSSLDCVVAIDHEGRVVEFNPAAELTFGYPRREAIGREMAELIVPPGLRAEHRRGLARYLETGEGPLVDNRVEVTGMRADGTELPIELTITRVDVEGPPVFTGYLRDISERQREERVQRFLAKSSALLAGSLDYAETLTRVAGLAVPEVADWCAVDLLADDGSIRHLATAHVDPERKRLAHELRERYPPDPDAPQGVGWVIRTGRTEHYPEISDAQLEAAVSDGAQRDLLRRLGMHSAIVVPMVARDRILGAITLGGAESGRRLQEADVFVAEELARRAALAIDNARLYGERDHVAEVLQRRLLPDEIPEIPGMDVAVRYHAAGSGIEVGGDFYDVFGVEGGDWLVVNGDVSGKGPEAAAITALARYTLRAVALWEQTPSRALGVLNDTLARQWDDAAFCTAACARVSVGEASARVLLGRAGHPYPIVVRHDGTIEVLEGGGMPLGVMANPEIEDYSFELAPGDALVLYTDGVSEARLDSGGVLGTTGLTALLTQCAGQSAEHLAQAIEDAAVRQHGGPARDDVSLVVLRAGKSG